MSGDSIGEDIAVAHWGEHVNGGGDRVAWELSRVFDTTPLYVGWRDETIEPDDIETTQIINGRIHGWALRRGGMARMLSHMLGWQVAEPLRGHDVLVTSGNEPLFYVPPTEQTWVAYIHHTNRRQSDQIDELGDGSLTPVKLLLYYAIRVAFDHNTHKPNLFLANSEQVKRRMIRYWGIPAEKIEVVYPPVDTHEYSPDDAETNDYYLTLSRLDWHKSVDDIVRAFDNLDATLVVAGDGPEREKLERMAGENVEFAGYVSESTKKELLAEARAFVFNGQDEDFGISPVEALAAGTPLIGVEEGMTQYQIVDGKNGYSFARDPSGTSIREAVARFESEGVKWESGEIEEFADRFSVDAFHDRVRSAVWDAVQKSNTEPDWYSEISGSGK
ncbi:glycosyltransferase [Halorubrum sp. Atlit-26R]|uniref:glycosyltransferase n=1 Tax=Halorubrum sp. Atlit-26R TaxID=2282128 RepID=UPI000EF21281|nr:glycosyltransferase [Halorubrum sp. Atlit-26R]RLM64052.1 glycosyltransferase [Halorubrum sp. Atlit-26R]